MHSVSNDLVVHAGRESASVRPLAICGLGLSALAVPRVANAAHIVVQVGSGLNFGGGVNFILGRWGVRFDVRQRLARPEFGNVVNVLHGMAPLPSRLRTLEYSSTAFWNF